MAYAYAFTHLRYYLPERSDDLLGINEGDLRCAVGHAITTYFGKLPFTILRIRALGHPRAKRIAVDTEGDVPVPDDDLADLDAAIWDEAMRVLAQATRDGAWPDGTPYAGDEED